MGWETTIPHTSVTLLQVVTAAAVLVVGLIIARIVVGVFKRSLRSSKLSDVLVEFLGRFFGILLYILVILVVLSTLGVTVGSILLSLSAVVGLILGFGMQDTVNNVASGTWIAALRPIDIGEYVTINGMSGTVKAVGIMATELVTPDNQFITIPNAQVWGSPIVNVTRMPTRRVDVSVGIAYGDNIEDAVKVAMDLMEKHGLVLDDPAPAVLVSELADSSVNLVLRPWTKTGDFWTVRGDLTKAIYDALPKAGLSIPFPQVDVHLLKEKRPVISGRSHIGRG
ncbi:MAG: mechanosensitive ion channel, partial [Candidatus Eisenbacteria bacterium]|nr:mechanosensitive ion channel [Candidatus Eisenbacteria bacterium]